MSNGLQHGERGEVHIQQEDGTEVVLMVYDHVSVERRFYVNSVNGYEEFQPSIAKGDMGGGDQPDGVTKRVANLLYDDFGIDVEDHGIRVVDMSRDEVSEL